MEKNIMDRLIIEEAWTDLRTNRGLYGDGNGQLRKCLMGLVEEAASAVGGVGTIKFIDGHLRIVSRDAFTIIDFFVYGGRINELFWTVEVRDPALYSISNKVGIVFSGYMGMEPLAKMVWLMGCARFMAVSEPHGLI